MESFDQQELRARKRLRTRAVVKASLLAGVLVFVVPSGGPWMSQEAFTAAMGRIVSSNWIVDVVAHFLLAFIYGWILGPLIYKPPTALGIVLGALLGIGLYALNYVTIGMAIGKPGYELHVAIEHVVFALFFSVAYRAMAVPPPRGKPDTSSNRPHFAGK